MPENATADMPARVRAGLFILVDWLSTHPDIALSNVCFADDEGADVSVGAGGVEVLEAIRAAASAMDGDEPPPIEVYALEHKRVCQLAVNGYVKDRPDFAITVDGCVQAEANDALVAYLGTPALPGARSWTASVDDLDAVLDRVGAR